MPDVTVSIVGASGYTGGELIRLLLFHPHVDIRQVTSERFVGKSVPKVHPNLRKMTDLKFSSVAELQTCDVLFLALPHGESSKRFDQYRNLAPRIIDLSADFRLNDADAYHKWYGEPHSQPDRLRDFVYGIPELHRDEMRSAQLISSAGCNATATILALWPLFQQGMAEADRTVVEVKVGSSEAGNASNAGSHHPIRSGCVRSFQPTAHRHLAEIVQELSVDQDITVHFSATAIEMVRGVLATCHVFLKEPLEDKDIWRIYRAAYGAEPFIRIIKERQGSYRYPEPKILAGTNLVDIGFEVDRESNRLVVISAIDNLMKGAAGQAVQALNIMLDVEETTALEFTGLCPI